MAQLTYSCGFRLKLMLASSLPQLLLTSTYHTFQDPHTSILSPLTTSTSTPSFQVCLGGSSARLLILLITHVDFFLSPVLSHYLNIAVAMSSLLLFSALGSSTCVWIFSLIFPIKTFHLMEWPFHQFLFCALSCTTYS